jgi:hypothetical protein
MVGNRQFVAQDRWTRGAKIGGFMIETFHRVTTIVLDAPPVEGQVAIQGKRRDVVR